MLEKCGGRQYTYISMYPFHTYNKKSCGGRWMGWEYEMGYTRWAGEGGGVCPCGWMSYIIISLHHIYVRSASYAAYKLYVRYRRYQSPSDMSYTILSLLFVWRQMPVTGLMFKQIVCVVFCSMKWGDRLSRSLCLCVRVRLIFYLYLDLSPVRCNLLKCIYGFFIRNKTKLGQRTSLKGKWKIWLQEGGEAILCLGLRVSLNN